MSQSMKSHRTIDYWNVSSEKKRNRFMKPLVRRIRGMDRGITRFVESRSAFPFSNATCEHGVLFLKTVCSLMSSDFPRTPFSSKEYCPILLFILVLALKAVGLTLLIIQRHWTWFVP